MSDVEFRESKISGIGLFALRRFRRGETVTTWDTTHRVPREEVDLLSAADQKYLHPLDENYFIIVQPPERYVNHSCDNNTVVQGLSDVAVRDIEPGEEITSDYELDSSGTAFNCSCGAANCRGVICWES